MILKTIYFCLSLARYPETAVDGYFIPLFIKSEQTRIVDITVIVIGQ